MAKTILNATIQMKNDTEANWNRKGGFIPAAGEIIVYLADEEHTTPRIKVGNGHSTLTELPFITEGIDFSNAVAQRVSHKLIFGNGQTFEYDGSQEVVVPVYTGN